MIWTFFYGSWINLDILKEKDFYPDSYEIARLHGFDIAIAPLANVFPKMESVVYGILITTDREKHSRMLYALSSNGAMGTVYLPQAVLVETLDGKLKPALCYTSERQVPKRAKSEYIEPLLASARKWGFPKEYIQHLESFRLFQNP